jgi:hypothetical protein
VSNRIKVYGKIDESLGLYDPWQITSELYVSQGSDQAKTNTTLANSSLALSLEASATYTGICLLCYDGSTTGDLKDAFTWPSGATGWYASIGANAGFTGTAMVTASASGTTISFGANGVGAKLVVPIYFMLTTTSAGTLQHQFAQNTTDGTNGTTLYAASYLAARRRA